MKNYILTGTLCMFLLGDAENTHTTMSMKVMTMKRKYMQRKNSSFR